ncbi:MAG: hypothetical protein AAGA77_01835 [Bacteroidota bacterium]
MRFQFRKGRSFLFVYLFSLLILQISCSDSDECTTTLIASAEVSSPTICSGETAELTFTGTSGATISYDDGSETMTVTLDGTGNAVLQVMPSESTTYTLREVSLDNCIEVLSESILLEIGGPAISENIIGDWTVLNVNDESDGKTVSFLADGTGNAPMDGSFTMYSTLLLEYSDGFSWEYNEFTRRLVITYNLGFGYPVNYEVDLNDCDEIVLRDVTHVADPQHAFALMRQ